MQPQLTSPSAAYVRQWTGSTLVRLTACRMKQCCVIVNWTLKNKLHWNSNQNTTLFVEENAFENVVCEMAAILPGGGGWGVGMGWWGWVRRKERNENDTLFKMSPLFPIFNNNNDNNNNNRLYCRLPSYKTYALPGINDLTVVITGV